MKQNESQSMPRKQIGPSRIEELPSFKLAGISVVTTNVAELSGKGKIGKLFEQYYSNAVFILLSLTYHRRKHLPMLGV